MREIDQVRRPFDAVSFLTLIGAGGVGKSCLAAEVVRRRVSAYEDGVV
jgi:predicted ATPase